MVLQPIIYSVALLIDDMDSDCIAEWNPPDLDHSITYCIVPSSELMSVKYHIFTALVTMIDALNLTFAILFSIKLKQFVNLWRSTGEVSAQRKRAKFEELILKNNILTMIGFIATTLCYAGWAITGNLLFPYSDTMVNCIVIILMFNSHQQYYDRICGPCVMLYHSACDPHGKDDAVSSAEMVDLVTDER